MMKVLPGDETRKDKFGPRYRAITGRWPVAEMSIGAMDLPANLSVPMVPRYAAR